MEKNISDGVFDLLSNANSKSNFKGECFNFKGDLCQMSVARSVATNLGIRVLVEGGIPFVTSKEDFKLVVDEIVSSREEGWWNYATDEEYYKIKGKWWFRGKYLDRSTEIQEIAQRLKIAIQITPGNAPYANSKEDYDAIIENLDVK